MRAVISNVIQCERTTSFNRVKISCSDSIKMWRMFQSTSFSTKNLKYSGMHIIRRRKNNNNKKNHQIFQRAHGTAIKHDISTKTDSYREGDNENYSNYKQ